MQAVGAYVVLHCIVSPVGRTQVCEPERCACVLVPPFANCGTSGKLLNHSSFQSHFLGSGHHNIYVEVIVRVTDNSVSKYATRCLWTLL